MSNLKPFHMKIKAQKQILYFLEALQANWEGLEEHTISHELLNIFNREELEAMVLWLLPNLDESSFTGKTNAAILELMNCDVNVLAYFIEQWKAIMVETPKIEQEAVDDFFRKNQKELHYLASKPVTKWDRYDKSNYHALLAKTNTTKKVYAIFTSDVLAEDVYAVTTKPSYFFDTKEEAEAALANIIKEENFKAKDLTIHTLWLMQN